MGPRADEKRGYEEDALPSDGYERSLLRLAKCQEESGVNGLHTEGGEAQCVPEQGGRTDGDDGCVSLTERR